jgi:hypothetical protein
VAELAFRFATGGFAGQRDASIELWGEGGVPDGGTRYGRVAIAGQAVQRLGRTRLQIRVEGGVGSPELPAHRAFVMGGHGTLLGEDFRQFGGRRALLLHSEWRVPVHGPGLGVGAFARIPTTLTIAPFVAIGWTDAVVKGAAIGVPTDDSRPTVGAALEWLGLIRLEVGYGIETRNVRVAFDLTRDFWPIL